MITYTAGLVDDFASPTDPASPSAALSGLTANPADDFDSMVLNRWIAHTFLGLPTNIVEATLEVKIKGLGVSGGGVENDDFWLGFFETALSDLVYRQPLGSRGDTVTGLATGPTGEWLPGSIATLQLDLSALPLQDGTTKSILRDLNVNGFLDVIVADDTSVDYMKLTVEAVPVPSVLHLIGIGLISLTAARRSARFKRA